MLLLWFAVYTCPYSVELFRQAAQFLKFNKCGCAYMFVIFFSRHLWVSVICWFCCFSLYITYVVQYSTVQWSFWTRTRTFLCTLNRVCFTCIGHPAIDRTSLDILAISQLQCLKSLRQALLQNISPPKTWNIQENIAHWQSLWQKKNNHTHLAIERSC